MVYYIQVKCSGKWRNGIAVYATRRDAEKRLRELNEVGITARVREAEEVGK